MSADSVNPVPGSVELPVNPHAAGYSKVQQYIEMKYRQLFDAEICCSYPCLVALLDSSGEPQAAMGIRSGVDRFFLEQYLEAPVEEILAARFYVEMPRKEIVELGNLAGDKVQLLRLMSCTWSLLDAHEIDYVTVTATQSLKRFFRQQPFEVLAEAMPERVENKTQWGRYYDARPQVLAARVADFHCKFAALAQRQQHSGQCNRGGYRSRFEACSFQLFLRDLHAEARFGEFLTQTTAPVPTFSLAGNHKLATAGGAYHGS